MCVGLLGLIFGSFFDLKISENLVSTTNPYGMFFETFGILLGFVTIPVAGVMIFHVAKGSKNIWFKILGWVILIAAWAFATFFGGKEMRAGDHTYGYRFAFPIALVITGVTYALFMVAAFFLINSENKEKLLRIAAILVAQFALRFAFVELTKRLACRPRYRFLIDSTLNTNNEVFKNWWEWSPFKFHNDFHKSFPSGHSACTSSILLWPLIYTTFRKQNNIVSVCLKAFVVIYLFAMMLGRIVIGAHFLSDVGVGCFIGALMGFLSESLFPELKFKKTEENN